MKTIIISFIVCSLLSAVCMAQWSEQTSPVTTALYSVSAVDNDVVWSCGAGGKVLRSTNGGSTWTVTTSPNQNLSLYNIWGIDAQTALVTGSSTTTYLYRTSTGGSSWNMVFSQTGGFINVVGRFSINGTYAFLGDPVGGRWTIFGSTDQGVTWDSSMFQTLMASGNEAGWNNSGCAMDSFNIAWFGTNNTRIYEANGNWITQPTPGLTNSYAVWANSINTIMTGGRIMLRSTNGGFTWNDVNAPGTGNILGITGGGTKWWYVRGTSVYYSSNDGTNWTSAYTSSGTYNHLAKSRSGGNIWAVKNNGGISKYNVLTGIQPVSNEIPIDFVLYQNYPNPFNPNTKFKFQIANLTTVNIKIFDELGREAAILLNEKLKPGTYEINWDASNSPSGVYFYKLTAEDFTESKKMMLLK